VRDQGGAVQGARGEALFVTGLLVAGALLAGVWRLLTPLAAGLGDEQEASAAVDGTLALLGIAAGVITAAVVLVRPGPRPALRALAGIGGSIPAGAISWQLGDLLGTPALSAIAAAFTWPVSTAVALFVGAMLPVTSDRLNGADRDGVSRDLIVPGAVDPGAVDPDGVTPDGVTPDGVNPDGRSWPSGPT
jgi:hypothetical protein